MLVEYISSEGMGYPSFLLSCLVNYLHGLNKSNQKPKAKNIFPTHARLMASLIKPLSAYSYEYATHRYVVYLVNLLPTVKEI